MSTKSRRVLHLALFAFLLAWAAYSSALVTGHFLSLIPKYRGESAWLILVALGCIVVMFGRQSLSGAPTVPPRLSVMQAVSLVVSFGLLSLVLYVVSLPIGLLSDDFVLLDHAARNQFVVRSWHLRPLPLLVWSLVNSIAHTASCLHAVNIALHAVNAALVVVLARRLGLTMRASVVAGAMFVCFPGSVEPVAWACGIQDLLATGFCLAFVLASGFSERPDLVMPLSMAALFAALLSKETAVVAPVLAVAAWFGSKDRWDVRPVLWGFLMVAVYAAVRMSVFVVDSGFLAMPSHYFTKELISRAFSTLAAPFAGRELLRFPVLGVVLAWFFGALLVLAVWDGWRDRRSALRVTRCALWALVPALPVWSALFISADLQGSRYLYLSTCGWSVLLAGLLVERQTTSGRDAGTAVAALLLVVWCLGVRSHLTDWQEAASVRERVLASAASHLRDTPCRVVRFTELPDSVRGAYVFRNGFLEALEHRGALRQRATLADAVQPGCTLQWNGKGFR